MGVVEACSVPGMEDTRGGAERRKRNVSCGGREGQSLTLLESAESQSDVIDARLLSPIWTS